MDFAAMMPLAKTLGVTIDEGTKDRVAGKLPVRADICTAGDIVHGGAIMAFADCLGAVGAFLPLPEAAPGTTTLESNDRKSPRLNSRHPPASRTPPPASQPTPPNPPPH